MKLASVVGTRPEVIKMAPVWRACAELGVPHVLVHTGQHWSYELDAVFFRELALPEPDHRLEVGSPGDAEQVAAVLAALAPILRAEAPDVVLVQGDTNSVLAGALAANKCGVALAHVEAGLRSYDREMPEEHNRRVADHLADWLFAPTPAAREILLGEGVEPGRIHVTGNTVVDELLFQRQRARAAGALARLGVEPGRYAVATVHRRENVESPERLSGIFAGLAEVGRRQGLAVLAALHPRTRQALERFGIAVEAPVRSLPPQGYLDFLALQADAALVLTDSGGLQEEACCLGVPCVTLRDNTERPESLEVGANVLAGTDPETIAARAAAMREAPRGWKNPFGDGHSGRRIVELLGGGSPRGAAAGVRRPA